MMSIDHQKDHFKRSRDEEEEMEVHTQKKRKMEATASKEQDPVEFQKNMYRSYIKSALDALDNNKSTAQLDTLASQISLPRSHPEAIRVQNFAIILTTLTNNISKLESKHADTLIFAIINYAKWYSLDTGTIAVFIKFILTLSSYLPKWGTEISWVLISQFTLNTLHTEYHHELLKYFFKTIPTSVPEINKQLGRLFPNKNNDKSEIVNYVSNLLVLNDYCDELRFNVWSLIIERSIQIDVELQNELDELDDDSEFEEEEEEEEEADDEDDDDNEDDQDQDSDGQESEDGALKPDNGKRVHFADTHDLESEGGSDSEDGIEEEVNEHDVQVANITDLSEKLDCILSLVFANFEKMRLDSDDEDDEERAIQLHNTLTSLFKSHILPTYYTKSTQFILFHYTQQSPELMDSFLVTLIDLCFSADETIEKRIKSLQYLSSYLSRAKMLQKSQIVFVLSYLMSWLNRYVESREVEIDGTVNMDRFKLFYSTFQVLLYIFCFRHSVLKNGQCEWELGLDKFFQRMLITKFNPLKFCNENVVLMFAKIAQEENVAYCFTIIQKNKSETLRGISGSGTSSKNGASNATLVKQQFVDLEGYFPFDPLFLKDAKKHLEGLYIEWSTISREYESDSDVDDLANDAKEAVRRNSLLQGSDDEE